MTNYEEDSSAIDILPDEILLYIFKLLPVDFIIACEHVCHRWRRLARDSSVWRPIHIVYSGKPGQSDVSKKNLEIIATHGELIHHIKLQYVYGYQYVKAIIDNCENLLSLELVMCRICIDFEEDIKKWPQLKKLNLKNCLLLLTTETKDDLVIQYDYFKDLNHIELADFGLGPENCYSLLKCQHLTHILIEKIKNLDAEFVETLISTKQNMLVTLHLYGGNSINDHCLHLISQCPMLKDLAIIRCESLTDQGLVTLANLQKIEHLQLWNNVHFCEANLLQTLSSKNLVKLESLSLSRIANISPVIVDIISEYYKNLKFLAVYQCPRIINTDYEKQLKSKFRNIDVVLY